LDCNADISETARGDHLAFGRIVVAHQDRIFAYLGRIGLDSTVAEDVAQETFLRVWRHAGKYNSRLGSLTSWILTIARNQALTHYLYRHHGPERPSASKRWRSRRTGRCRMNNWSRCSAGNGFRPGWLA
jgi:RNA polymerase sigma-70 factor (ECF subfamily)